jgi:ParB/RepB/Spo0J family partition protein
MAKRKRLSPARVDATPAPENKALPRSATAAPTGLRPPIADVAHDAVTSAALMELSDKMSEARQTGRWIDKIPLEHVDALHLERDRDRDSLAAEDMEALIASLAARGQQTAIEVTPLGEGRYGLISGWRRLHALRQLQARDASVDTVLAIIRTPEDAADAYLAMVEENEVRSDLSFYERGRIVMRAVDLGVFRTDRLALSKLFQAVPRSKRSKINSFVRVARVLDDCLTFPTALTEKLGLAMAKALADDDKMGDRLRAALTCEPAVSATAEARTIMDVLTGQGAAPAASKPRREEISPGIYLTEQPGGRIILEGDMLKNRTTVSKLKDLLRGLE